MLARLAVPLHLQEERAGGDRDVRRPARDRHGFLVGGQRLLLASGLVERLSQALPGVHHLRVVRDQLLEEGDRLGEPLRRHQARRLPEGRQGVDPVLGIGQRAVARRRSAGQIAERGEAAGRLGVDLRRRRQRRLVAGDRLAQGRIGPALPLQDVLRLRRIGGQVVELGPRRLDEVRAVADQRGQLAPAEVQARVPGLRVEVARGRLLPPQVEQRAAVEPRGDRPAGQGQQGRGDVHQLRRRGDRGPAEARSGELQEQRHLQGLAVEEDPVLRLAVLAQPLAVVGEQDDHGLVVDPPVFQLLQEPPTTRRPRRSRRRRERPCSARRTARGACRACGARRGGRRGRTACPPWCAATRGLRPASPRRTAGCCPEPRSGGASRRPRRRRTPGRGRCRRAARTPRPPRRWHTPPASGGAAGRDASRHRRDSRCCRGPHDGSGARRSAARRGTGLYSRPTSRC